MNVVLQACAAQHPAATLGARLALQPMSLALAPGEQVAVIGPSGAGKTTLLHLLACALQPALGQLQLQGLNPWALPPPALQRLRTQIFLAPQAPPLPPRQRVVTAVLAGCLPAMGLWRSVTSLLAPSAAHIALADAALERFDASSKLFERVDRLSGGERQRVGLARALVANAQLLLIDEPLSALDPRSARQAMASLCTHARANGATLVASLHHVEMALQHFPRILGLKNGELQFDLPASQVSPAHLQALYAQHPEELHAQLGTADDLSAPSAPVLMQCR